MIDCILGLDAIGSIITFAFGFFVLGRLIPKLSSAQKRRGNGVKGQEGDSGLEFFPSAAIANENWNRVASRSVAKCGAVFVWLLLVKTRNAGGDPTHFEMLVFHIWFGVMGLVDELDDNIMPLRKARGIAGGIAVQCVRYGLYAYLLLAIPYLVAANDLFCQDAVVIVLNQMLGKKLDTPVFVGTAIIGIPSIGFMGWYSGTLTGWPIVGMMAVILGHILYEIHDENPLLMRFNQTFKVPLIIYQITNQHFFIVVLVGVGLLPSKWLLCSSLAYPIAKLGVAYGP